MLTGLSIRDVVLIDRLDLTIGTGLTALTGETGAGKSIVLDALGLATGARAEAGLIRRGAAQAGAAAVFGPGPGHPAWAYLQEKGFDAAPGEDLVMRRQLTADGRSKAFVNDQPASAAVLRDLGNLLLEVHGQHETHGLLDPRTHRALLDNFGAHGDGLQGVAGAWKAWRDASIRLDELRTRTARSASEAEEIGFRLAELDRLDPREGEEAVLAEARALLGAAEKALADIGAAKDSLGGDALSGKLAQGIRALARARDRAVGAGAAESNSVVRRLDAAAEALDRALIEATEALAAIDAAADAFDFEPDQLDKAEERLFALRAAARKLGVTVDELPAVRVRFAEQLRGIESVEAELSAAEQAAQAAEAQYRQAAAALSKARRTAGERLGRAVEAELAPLKLDKARFRVAVTPLPEERAGPAGQDRVEFEVSTNPGAPFGPLAAIASGGELARFSLALRVALASRSDLNAQSLVMIFDEVDQGVGGAVADAVGLRLKCLAETGQVLVVTHSPQIAARADTHWRVIKRPHGDGVVTAIETLEPADRQEEIARMLAGAEVTDAARAAALALIGA
jgi:DNA repair protein RecN (Recombination protein N)